MSWKNTTEQSYNPGLSDILPSLPRDCKQDPGLADLKVRGEDDQGCWTRSAIGFGSCIPAFGLEAEKGTGGERERSTLS
jgi:hypothetical protein